MAPVMTGNPKQIPDMYPSVRGYPKLAIPCTDTKTPLAVMTSGVSDSYSGDDPLSHGKDRSTIGAGGLNCRVRDGNGCGPAAIATGNF